MGSPEGAGRAGRKARRQAGMKAAPLTGDRPGYQHSSSLVADSRRSFHRVGVIVCAYCCSPQQQSFCRVLAIGKRAWFVLGGTT